MPVAERVWVEDTRRARSADGGLSEASLLARCDASWEASSDAWASVLGTLVPGSVSTIERGGSDVDSDVLASASMQYVLELGGVVEQTNASMGLPGLLTR